MLSRESPYPGADTGERATKVRRMRKHVSCTECRARKIKCDRNVPNCSSCVQRGIRHHCRWGDERDALLPQESPSGAVNNATVYDVAGRINVTSSSSPNAPTPELIHQADHLNTFQATYGLPSLPATHALHGTLLSSIYTQDVDRWRQFMAPYFAQLPDVHHMDELVSFYLKELEPLISCTNSVMFLEDYSLLKSNLVMARGAPGTDKAAYHGDITESILGSLSGPATRQADAFVPSAFWSIPQNYGLLALLFVMLHTACDSRPSQDLFQRRMLPQCQDDDELGAALDRLHASAIFFLHESNAQEHPTLWTLQTIILLQRKPLHSLRVPTGAIWNSTALRMAQLMGLNRLGSASDDVSRMQRCERSIRADDSDILQRMPWLNEFAEGDLPKRELARKIWATLVMFDWMKSTHVDYTYMVSDEMNCTAPPAALTDEEMVRITSLSRATLKDPNRVSPTVFGRILLDLARCVRQSAAILVSRMSRHLPLTIDYPDAMKIDRQICEILDKMPRYFRFDGVSELSDDVCTAHAQHPYLSLQRLFLQEQIHFRLLRLHSPYLPMALRDPGYRRSLVACIEGARVTVAVWEELQRTENPNQQMHYMKWHLLSAAIVLDRVIGSMDVNGAGDPSTDYSRLKNTLRKAVQFLESRRVLKSFERLSGTHTLESLRQFCALPSDVPLSQSSGSQTPAAPEPEPLEPFSLQDEFVKLGNAIPTTTDTPDWGTDDATLLAGFDFIMMNSDSLTVPEMELPIGTTLP
ncbi:hypothetical protein MOBT1_002777 [Malassezia obtusa]|uniref:Zn(2)-C6 fungal-type domain-containing protein n=1 Tax=Malassezia obtusa TaxID=76774 RepID=A0AAF0E6W9_9BASI|nr:hypothetical protein MOBT1_002777 [Malassezia obtusa]